MVTLIISLSRFGTYNDFHIHFLAFLFPCFLITTDFVLSREPPAFSREICNLLSDPTASLHPPNLSGHLRTGNIRWNSGHILLDMVILSDVIHLIMQGTCISGRIKKNIYNQRIIKIKEEELKASFFFPLWCSNYSHRFTDLVL